MSLMIHECQTSTSSESETLSQSKGSLSDSKETSTTSTVCSTPSNDVDDTCLFEPISNYFRGRTDVVISRHDPLTAQLFYYRHTCVNMNVVWLFAILQLLCYLLSPEHYGIQFQFGMVTGDDGVTSDDVMYKYTMTVNTASKSIKLRRLILDKTNANGGE